MPDALEPLEPLDSLEPKRSWWDVSYLSKAMDYSYTKGFVHGVIVSGVLVYLIRR
jgi:hypothetical protein